MTSQLWYNYMKRVNFYVNMLVSPLYATWRILSEFTCVDIMAVWLTTYIQVYVYKMLISLTIFLKYLHTYVVFMNGINARSIILIQETRRDVQFLQYNTCKCHSTPTPS